MHLRAHGYWREDRASEDLSFELDAAAAGLHGKYLDVTKFTFQEAVCLDIEEELRRVSRYAFGAAEIVAHPIRDWRRHGVLTGQLKALLRSPHVPRRVKVDKLAYLQVYFNRLLLLPLVICSGFWPVYHLGILGVCVGVVFTASYAAGVWVGMRGRRGNGAESYSTVAHRHFGYSILYRMNVLSSAYVTVRSLIQYFLSLSPEHPVSPVEGGGEAADREVSKEMVAALVRASVLSGVFAIGAVWGYWHGIPRVERWLSYYAFLNLVLGPFLLSPRFVGMLRHRLSSRRCFG